MTSIVNEIFPHLTFSQEESDLITSKLQRKTLGKGEFLLRADETIEDIFYVQQGCLRSYFVDPEGKEHTLQFAIDSWWISDYIALFGHTKTRAVSYIECIKNAVVYRITKRDFDQLCLQFPMVGQFHIQKMEYAFASFQRRILENLTLPARERYTNFVKAYPTIESNVKNYHIASFLGITTESLSRVRKEIAST